MSFKLATKCNSSPLGFLPHGWNLVKLKDVTTKIGSGATPRGGSSVYLPSRKNYALIRSQHVFNRRFDGTGLVFITDEHATELQKVAVHLRDVLLNITGDGVTFGRACIVPKDVLPACVNQHVSIIRTDPKVCLPEYLLCYLTHPSIKSYIESFNAGGSRRAITKGHIESFEVPIPPLDEQKAIAQILSSLDDKIELNQQMNRTLEAIARALFKSWFIDFDPVHAKLNGQQPAGIDAETAALFPAEFDDSVIGRIPKGWETKPLDQIADFLNGLALQKYPPEGDEYLPVIKIAELRKGITESSGKASPSIDSKYIIQEGDVLFSWSGSLEAIIWCGGQGALNQHLFKVSSKTYPKWFYYEWVKFHLPDFQSIAASKATTMGHIQRHHLTAALGVVPPQQIMKVADEKISLLLEKFIAKCLESRSLTLIRDALLPKLLSGGIRVKDAEKVVERVA